MSKQLTPKQRMNRAEWKFVGYFAGFLLVVAILWRTLKGLFA